MNKEKTHVYTREELLAIATWCLAELARMDGYSVSAAALSAEGSNPPPPLPPKP